MHTFAKKKDKEKKKVHFYTAFLFSSDATADTSHRAKYSI